MKIDPVQAWALDPTGPIVPQVYALLREAIIEGALTPGNRISESEIAKSCNVSRQPVREAFIRLAGEGLLAVQPQRGTIVTRIDYAAVLDARFLREAIEADIAKILARAPDPNVLAALERELAAQRAAEDARAFIRCDERFHRTLAEAAGKGGAWSLIDGLKSQMDRVRFLSLDRFRTEHLIVQHEGIVARIAAGDMIGANAATRSHLRGILDDLPAIVAAHPQFFDRPEGDLPHPVNAPIPGNPTKGDRQ